jgi:hypothetical protein
MWPIVSLPNNIQPIQFQNPLPRLLQEFKRTTNGIWERSKIIIFMGQSSIFLSLA